ncbi:hypothetical protein [Caudoviricetes sp.]|nr:hypothetical protein [Caudoviricetes sp.]UOF79685.1 hypothetical protein [Caudoviricetes sp.]UOF79841.1 hypothetical protein [Bacteriophage sp.]UOF81356.1 hypothetical protein [Caudoviricetes sp.]
MPVGCGKMPHPGAEVWQNATVQNRHTPAKPPQPPISPILTRGSRARYRKVT